MQVFCTKKQPNCNACPMRGECRHFASAFASAFARYDKLILLTHIIHTIGDHFYATHHHTKKLLS